MKLRTGRRTSKPKTSKRQINQGKSRKGTRKLRSGSFSSYNLDDHEDIEEDDDTVRYEGSERKGITHDGSGLEADEFEEKGKPVFDLDLGSQSDSQDSSDDEDDDEDVIANLSDHLPHSVRGEPEVESSDEEDDEEESNAKMGYSDTWGSRKAAYYDADTADLEIGQDFEDAEEEELAALESQRAEAKQLDEADLWDMEGDDNEDASFVKSSGSSHDHHKSGRNHLELMMSEAPELRPLLSRLKRSLLQLTGTIDPLCRIVTEDIGASKDGLQYLMCKRQLLLSWCINTCFYLLLRLNRDEGSLNVKGHPVMFRLVQLKKISESLEPVDGTLSAQVELLKEALESGIDFNQKDNDEVLSDTSSISELEVGEKGNDKENLLMDEMMMEEDSHNRQLRVNKANADMDKEESFLERGALENTMRNSIAAARKRESEVRRIGRRHKQGGDFGDDDTAYETYRRENLVGIVNPVQAAANRAMQKSRLGPRSRSITGGDTEVEYAAAKLPYGQKQSFLEDEEWQYDAATTAGEEGVGEKDNVLFDRDEAARLQKVNNMNDLELDSAEYLENTLANKASYKAQKLAKYNPGPRIAGTLQEELDANMEAISKNKGLGHKRAASYAIIKNRGLIAHKNKVNRNPRVKKKLAYRKAVIRRKGQVRDMRSPGEADAYGGEATGIRTKITRGRKL